MEIVLAFASGNRDARVSDLSLGGCFVDTIQEVDEGETIRFELKLHSGLWLKLQGRIVYSMPGIGFGIRFENLSEEQIAMIEETIELHGGKPRAPGDASTD
jgi:hypothetical protein